MSFLGACDAHGIDRVRGWELVKNQAKTGKSDDRKTLRRSLAITLRDAIVNDGVTLAEACERFNANYDRGWGMIQGFPEVKTLMKLKWERGATTQAPETCADADVVARDDRESEAKDAVSLMGEGIVSGNITETRSARRERIGLLIRDAIVNDGLKIGPAGKKYGVTYDRAWAMVKDFPEVRELIAAKWRRDGGDDVVTLMRRDILTGGMTLSEAAKTRGVHYDWAWNKLSRDPDIRAKIDSRWPGAKGRKARTTTDGDSIAKCGPALAIDPKEPIANDLLKPISASVRERAAKAIAVPLRTKPAPRSERRAATQAERRVNERMVKRIASGFSVPDTANERRVRDQQQQAAGIDMARAWRDESCGTMILLIDTLEQGSEPYAPRFEAEIETVKDLEDRADALPMLVLWFDDETNRIVISPNPNKVEDFLNEQGYFRGESRFERMFLAIMDYLELTARYHHENPMALVKPVDVEKALAAIE
jgi:molybdenum-dependent DNA-binding transcriptional regulator ModE